MVEAKHLAVFLGVLATSVILVIYISKQPGGYIETRGKSTCSWRTEGDSTTNSRAMLFECQCQNGKEYKCKYEANPDKHCPKFHKDIFGYFKQIREAVAGKYNHMYMYM